MGFIYIDNENTDYYISFLTFTSNYRKIGVDQNTGEDQYEEYANSINSFKNYLTFPSSKKVRDASFKSNEQIIYISFHFGPYKLLVNHLISKGIDVALLIGKEFYTEESEFINELHKKESTSKNRGDLVLLDISDRKSFIQLKRLISKGYSVFSFIDNYEVKDENTQKSNYDNVTFFNTELSIKNGIIRISKLFNIKIALLLCYMDNDTINITLHEFSSTPKMQDVFDVFGKSLSKYPYQWEPWLYCNNWFVEQPKNVSLETLKSTEYELLKTDNGYFIYHYDNLLFYEIDAKSFENKLQKHT